MQETESAFRRMKNGRARKVCAARLRYVFSSCGFYVCVVAIIPLLIFSLSAKNTRKTRVIPSRLFHVGVFLIPSSCVESDPGVQRDGTNFNVFFWFLDSPRFYPSHSDAFLCGVIFDPQRNEDLCHTFAILSVSQT